MQSVKYRMMRFSAFCLESAACRDTRRPTLSAGLEDPPRRVVRCCGDLHSPAVRSLTCFCTKLVTAGKDLYCALKAGVFLSNVGFGVVHIFCKEVHIYVGEASRDCGLL